VSPLHFSGVVLPEGEQRDLYVVDGRLTYDRVASATTVSRGGFLVPGLVDAHCHVGLAIDGGVPVDEQEAQALADRDAGALLLRNPGTPVDTRWIDERDDLPRMIRAGRHIARTKRYLRNYGVEIEPDELVPTVVAQARAGDGWVKLVGDWIDREVGDLAPCWPPDSLRAGIAAAHAEGARVTAHVFGEVALPDLLAAGIDCLEHGVGLSDALLADMAARGIALVPTRLQVDNFESFAAQGEAKFPAYASHMRALLGRVDDMLRNAYDAGVPLYAGTDAGGFLPHGLIGQEILAMSSKAGIPAFDALGAGSWRAREWLGLNATLDEGAPADFVVYEANPLDDLRVLLSPSRIVLRGTVY
jgi:imidazolonepropionase-like amidohydrolase